jgi:hypothetical protein
MQYLYDAEGHRVAKGTISAWSCDTSSNGFIQTASYILGPSGEQVTEMDGNGNWQHTNVYAAGQLVATYKNDALAGQAVTAGVHFHLADWLGTNRVQLTSGGQSEETCQSLPSATHSTAPVLQTQPNTTSPAKNEIRNQGSTTSGPGITAVRLDDF